MQIDRASVWRSASLRRGALVMAILPGRHRGHHRAELGLPGAADRAGRGRLGLLFGVNAFGIDGPGALTLEGLPMRPELRYWAKAATILEFSGLTVAGALVVGALRADGRPTATQLVALVAAALVTSLAVASFCMNVSVKSPHRSDLRGRRDTPPLPAP